MLYEFKQILDLAEKGEYCVPAFNVYNLETVMGVLAAAEEAHSPVIMQLYSRLIETENSVYVSPIVLEAAKKSKVPVCLHLDHGANKDICIMALRDGYTGIMIDRSQFDFETNIKETKDVVDLCNKMHVGVEGELGHIGKAADGVDDNYTKVEEAVRFVNETGVSALAIAVGTAHGRYKQAPVLAIKRIEEIKRATGIPLVLHGGSGVPDDQIKLAIKAGVRKMNFSTDLCYSFLDAVNSVSRDIYPIDLYMKEPINAVKKFCLSKIEVLGSKNRV